MNEKTALLCGGAQGLGKRIAEKFLESGWSVFVIDLFQKEIADSIRYFKCDVSNFQETQSTIEKILSERSIEALVNTIRYRKPSHSNIPAHEEWKQSIDIDLHTYFNAAYIVCKAMQQRKQSCSIINLSSILSTLVNPRESIGYHASKAAINQITRHLAVQYGPDNIRVNSVLPGLISNEKCEVWSEDPNASHYSKISRYIPLRRSGDPKDVAELVHFLASDASSFITGQSIVIDGGLSIQDQLHMI